MGRQTALLALFVACVLIAPRLAGAQSSQDLFQQVFGNSSASQARPITVPVTIDGHDAGDVEALVNLTTASAAVQARDLVTVLTRYVKPEVTRAVAAAADSNGRVDLAAIKAAGLGASFDTGQLQLVLSVPAKLRPEQSISLRGGYGVAPGKVLKPAGLSAYLNIYSGLRVVTSDSSGTPGALGRQPISSAFQGAVNLNGSVLEANAFYQEDASRPWQRGNVRAIFDNQKTAVRTTAGDLTYPTASFQGFVPMGGLSIARDFNIKPYLTTQPSGRHSLLLQSASTVDVMVNGQTVQTLNLPPGPYTLSDFPISSGANNVTLRVHDAYGRTENVSFSQFYDGSLLQPGLSEFGAAFGFPSYLENGLYHYDTARPSFSGFYRKGLTETLTAGANLQANKDVAQAGGELRMATAFGNFLIEPSASWAAGSGLDGALDLEEQYFQPLGKRFPGERLWNLSAILRGPSFTELGATQPSNPVSLQLAGRVSQLIDRNNAIALGARYGFSRTSARSDTNDVSLLLRHNLWREASFDITLDHSRGTDGVTTNSVLMSLRIPLGGGRSLRSTVDTAVHGYELRYTDRPNNPMNAITTDVTLDRNDTADSANAEFDYRNQRFDASLLSNLSNPRVEGGIRTRSTELDLSSALVYAGGHVAVSRPVTDSFAIVVPYANLVGRQIGVNPYDGTYQAQVDGRGPAVIPDLRSYEDNPLVIDVPNLPFGYDVGDTTPDVLPTLDSGTVVVVGTGATVLLAGTMVDSLGKPVALQAGELQRTDKAGAAPVEFFTNRGGKFRVDGVGPGSYDVHLYAKPKLRLHIEIPAGTSGLYDIGKLVVPAS